MIHELTIKDLSVQEVLVHEENGKQQRLDGPGIFIPGTDGSGSVDPGTDGPGSVVMQVVLIYC